MASSVDPKKKELGIDDFEEMYEEEEKDKKDDNPNIFEDDDLSLTLELKNNFELKLELDKVIKNDIFFVDVNRNLFPSKDVNDSLFLICKVYNNQLWILFDEYCINNGFIKLDFVKDNPIVLNFNVKNTNLTISYNEVLEYKQHTITTQDENGTDLVVSMLEEDDYVDEDRTITFNKHDKTFTVNLGERCLPEEITDKDISIRAHDTEKIKKFVYKGGSNSKWKPLKIINLDDTNKVDNSEEELSTIKSVSSINEEVNKAETPEKEVNKDQPQEEKEEPLEEQQEEEVKEEKEYKDRVGLFDAKVTEDNIISNPENKQLVSDDNDNDNDNGNHNGNDNDNGNKSRESRLFQDGVGLFTADVKNIIGNQMRNNDDINEDPDNKDKKDPVDNTETKAESDAMNETESKADDGPDHKGEYKNDAGDKNRDDANKPKHENANDNETGDKAGDKANDNDNDKKKGNNENKSTNDTPITRTDYHDTDPKTNADPVGENDPTKQDEKNVNAIENSFSENENDNNNDLSNHNHTGLIISSADKLLAKKLF